MLCVTPVAGHAAHHAPVENLQYGFWGYVKVAVFVAVLMTAVEQSALDVVVVTPLAVVDAVAGHKEPPPKMARSRGLDVSMGMVGRDTIGLAVEAAFTRTKLMFCSCAGVQ